MRFVNNTTTAVASEKRFLSENISAHVIHNIDVVFTGDYIETVSVRKTMKTHLHMLDKCHLNKRRLERERCLEMTMLVAETS